MKIHKGKRGEKSSSWKLNFTFATATPPPANARQTFDDKKFQFPLFFAKSFSAKNFRSICMLMMTTMETRQRWQKIFE